MKRKTLTNIRLGDLVRLLDFAMRHIKETDLDHRAAIQKILPEIDEEIQKDPRYIGQDFSKHWPSMKQKAENLLKEVA